MQCTDPSCSPASPTTSPRTPLPERPSAAVSGQIDAFAALTSDNPKQQARAAKLRDLVQQKFTEMQETIDVRHAGGMAPAVAIVLTNKGNAVMQRHVHPPAGPASRPRSPVMDGSSPADNRQDRRARPPLTLSPSDARR